MSKSFIHIINKKRVMILVFLLYCVFVKSQNPINNIYNPNNTWAMANNIYQTDSGYVSCGIMGDSIIYLKQNVVVSKYDNAGNQLKFIEIKKDSFASFAGNFSGGAMASCKNGGYAISLTQTNYIKNKIILIRLNNNLDTFWTKTIMDDTIYINTKHCIETSDKGFAMLGEKMVYNPNERSDVLFCKTDSMGNKLWEKAINIGGLSGADRILETPDKGFLICGYKTSNAQGVGDPLILKTDSAGNLLWYKFLGGNEKDGAASIAITPQGDYLVAYGYSTYTYPMNQYWAGRLNVIKYSAQGNQIWNKMYDTIRINYTVFNIQVLPNNDFFVIGSCVDKGNYFFLPTFFFKINNNGDSLYKKIYFYSDTYYDGNFLKDNIQTSDGGIIGIGNVMGDTIVPYQKIWILKTDSNGYAPGPHNFLRVEECINNKLISIFPNPATTQTTITYPTAEKDIMLQIYNMLGQVVCEEKLSKGSKQTTINTSTFKRGIYKITLGEYSNTLIINNE